MEGQINVINFVFEHPHNYRNFLKCPDINGSTISRFSASPLAVTLLTTTKVGKQFGISNKITPYIIATGVNHSPDDWAGSSLAYRNTRSSPFKYLNKKLLRDLQSGMAMILFDQSLEGYQTEWLWEYFHTECANYQINPAALIYTSGNTILAEQYSKWATETNTVDRINVIPYSHFESDMFQLAKETDSNLTMDQQISYKQNNHITPYNCLQKRLRNHRIWFYLKLFENNLLQHGLVSMNKFRVESAWMQGQCISLDRLTSSLSELPLMIYNTPNNIHDDSYYIRRIQSNVCLDSWVSVVSEASFADSDGTVFLSEKIFKPIVCMHPFIIVGNRGSLKKLKEMGYKTFEGFIDESYDDLPTFERLEAVIVAIKKIIAIEDKMAWYKSMSHILEHNNTVMTKNAKAINPAFVELETCYNQYFKLKN